MSTLTGRAVNPWAIALTVTIATFMEVLDTSIANVALRHIAGGLGASENDSEWVITSYLVANAIVLPLAGWMSSVFGRKNYYMVCVALFTLSSMLCGMAASLPQLVLFRVLQGLGGGGLQPSTQGILLDTFPPERRGMAMSVYGMAVLVAPILGPTLGGWITDNYSWRWIFYINVPAGLLSLALNSYLLEDPPYIKEQRAARRGQPLRVDFIGLGLLALGLACLEVVLAKGQQWDWLGDPFGRVQTLIVFCVLGLAGAVVWELRHPDPIVNFRLFSDRNFLASSIVLFAVFMVLFGSNILLPQMLQTLMGYDATSAGLVMSPSGFFTLLLMPLVGYLIGRHVDTRWLIATGAVIISAGSFWLSRQTLDISPSQVVWPRVVAMMGSAFVFVPLNTAAYAYLPKEQTNSATGLFSLLRNEGGSVGTSLAVTLLARREQFHYLRLGEGLNALNPSVNATWQQLTQFFQMRSGDPAGAQQQAWAYIEAERQRQALSLSYFDCFWLYGVLALLVIPLVLVLMRRSVAAKGASVAME